MAADLTVRERMADIARFIARPDFVAQPMKWGRGLLIALVAVFALDVGFDSLVYTLTQAWDEGVGFLPEPIAYESSLTEDLIGFLIFAPILEELAFRGWLSGRIAALRFGVYGFAAMVLLTASGFAGPAYAMPLALTGVAVVFAGLLQWGRTCAYDTQVPGWFTRHFGWFVWGSSLIFGLIHLGNYEPLTSPLGLLVVLPQTIGGLLLAYTRSRLGLRAAMLHHAAYNAVFLASDYGWW